MTAPLDVVLGRLDRVKAAGPGRWLARCPAHDDKHPSLSVSETSTGTVLVKCWGGCRAEAILGAIGLSFFDLFPRDQRTARPRAMGGRPRAKSLLHEHLIYQCGKAKLAKSGALSPEDNARYALAVQRLTDADLLDARAL